MSESGVQQATQCHIYVIDQDYRLIHVSEETRALFGHAQIGSLCFKALRGEDSVCHDCPWSLDIFRKEGSARKVIFNASLSQWLEITCTSVEWPGHGICAVVASKGISESNKDSFAQFTQQHVYDEVLEVDLNDNTFKILYSENDKYDLPRQYSSLDDIVGIAGHTIHPEDRKAFIKFWSPSTIANGFKSKNTGGRGAQVRGEFRQKLLCGEYRWTSQTIIPVERPDAVNIYLCFILDIEEQKQRSAREMETRERRLRLLREKDALTGLYHTEAFFSKVEELLDFHPDGSFEMACLDMKNFRLFNEWYGRDAGDELLRAIARRLKEIVRAVPAVAGYFGADGFGIVMPQGRGLETKLSSRVDIPLLGPDESIGFFPVVGICKIDKDGTSLRTVCDRATITKNLTKRNYSERLAWYEEEAARQVDDEVRLLLDIQRALKNGEFELYWQPQCDIRTGKVVGAEALVRWHHPQRGIVSPGEFVPLLEKTGFIANLDLFVWEEACRSLRCWLDEGLHPVPISVNVSRADMRSIDVPGAVEGFIRKYDIDRRLLKLEITETAFAESGNTADLATRLKSGGLTVLMDDFGSGYSSLNILKDIEVDILKMDMAFLNWTEESAGRGESIVAAVLHMTELMDMRVIAEGVETARQMDFLKSIGCGYAQGYYFYRPMPESDYRVLMADEDKMDYGGVRRDSSKLIGFDDLARGRVPDKSVLDGILGGIAVYEEQGGRYLLKEMSRQYRCITGDDTRAYGRDILHAVHPDDAAVAKGLFERARRDSLSGSQGVIRRFRADGVIMWAWMRMFFVGRQGGNSLFCGAIVDITDAAGVEEGMLVPLRLADAQQ